MNVRRASGLALPAKSPVGELNLEHWNRPLAKRISVGDLVTIRYKGYNEESFRVVHRPQGAGDLWQFEDEDGAVIAVNPYYPKLREIVRKA